MATEIQPYATMGPDYIGEWELFIYISGTSDFTVINDPGKGVAMEGEPWPSNLTPTTNKDPNVKWYFDSSYQHPIETSDFTQFVDNPDFSGDRFVFGGITLYGKLITSNGSGDPSSINNQVRFKEGVYASAKFENGSAVQIPHQPGTLFMATIGTGVKEHAHLFYDDGQFFINVIPKMLPLLYGGTGVDLTIASTNSVIYKDSSTELGGIATANGAFYATAANAKPQFGTLPVKQGGTGKTSFTKYGVVYGNSSSALKVTAAGEAGALFAGGGSSAAPKFVTPTVSWDNGTTAGPVFKLTVDTTNYTATIPSASNTASGIVTTDTQTFKGVKTFSDGLISNGGATFNDVVTISGIDDAYYNSSSDYKNGALNIIGGLTTSLNMRVDGGTVQFAKAAKIKYDGTKECFNFVF